MLSFGSTRSGEFNQSAQYAILNGLAGDGGLYVPSGIPDLPLDLWTERSFEKTAETIFSAFFGGFSKETITRAALRYSTLFSTPEITPLKQVGEAYVLELFHGPTAAFKDIALSVLPIFLTEARRELAPLQDILVLTATSGDTGSAALSGFCNVEGTEVLVFYPDHGISPIQKQQMVSMAGNNLTACGIYGNFDDAQSGVKRIFNQGLNQPKYLLSSANSINIGRLVPQMIYYFTAYAQLVEQKAILSGDLVNFIVPTGNFGDILAGYMAKKAGLPVAKLICASNENSVLADFLNTGTYDRCRDLKQTLSPSMDILISSNLERLLYLESGCDARLISSLMKSLQDEGRYKVPSTLMNCIRETFSGDYCTDEETLQCICRVYDEHKYLLDPHTAAAWHVNQKREKTAGDGKADIVLSTASPFKFPQTVGKALGIALEDDLHAANLLSKTLDLSLPFALEGLASRPVLHRDVIKPGAMSDYINQRWS